MKPVTPIHEARVQARLDREAHRIYVRDEVYRLSKALRRRDEIPPPPMVPIMPWYAQATLGFVVWVLVGGGLALMYGWLR